MATEIERKFLVKDDSWHLDQTGIPCQQGYFPTTGKVTIRTRIMGDKGFLTIKGPSVGLSRAEYEYEIPVGDASELLNQFCVENMVEKQRFLVSQATLTWEIDVFEGRNAGLVIAELELQHEDQAFPKPAWLGPEVSHDPRYRNAYLATHPYSSWAN